MNVRAREPFRFWGCTEIRESLGVRAESERQLMERLESVPTESVYYHTVRCLLRHQVVHGPYPDDFSMWVATEVRDPMLAEKLALSSPFDFDSTEAFKDHLIGILDDHLASLPFAPRIFVGSPFYFLKGHLAAVALDVEAADLAGFRQRLAEADDSSVYYHAVEAIGRLDRPQNDFAAWLDGALRLPALATRIGEIDPFVVSLSGLRKQILLAVDEELRH